MAGEKDVRSAGSEDFDFMGENEKTKTAGPKISKQQAGIATGGNPNGKPEDTEPEESPAAQTMGELDLATVLEARKRAESKSGLDIEAFVKEFKILSFDVEQVLNGPLPAK